MPTVTVTNASNLEAAVAASLKKVGITDKNIKFAPKDGALGRDSTGPSSANATGDKTKKPLRA